MELQAQMAALHILAVLGVLSAVVRLSLHACSAMPERVRKWQEAVFALYACNSMPGSTKLS
jgi:hypothetical protein